MSELQTLRDDYAAAEAKAQELMAARDAALRDLHNTYNDPLRDATNAAATLQKTLCDAEAAHALADRQDLPAQDKARLADALGLTLP